MELVDKIAYHLIKQDVTVWAMSGRQAYSIFPAPNIFGKFLECIAYGQQDKAERLLSDVDNGQQEKIQGALRYQGKFTDYSGTGSQQCGPVTSLAWLLLIILIYKG